MSCHLLQTGVRLRKIISSLNNDVVWGHIHSQSEQYHLEMVNSFGSKTRLPFDPMVTSTTQQETRNNGALVNREFYKNLYAQLIIRESMSTINLMCWFSDTNVQDLLMFLSS